MSFSIVSRNRYGFLRLLKRHVISSIRLHQLRPRRAPCTSNYPASAEDRKSRCVFAVIHQDCPDKYSAVLIAFLRRWALKNEEFCRKHVHWLPILIQSSALHFNDRLVWLGPGGQNLEDLAFHPQGISRPGWFGPCAGIFPLFCFPA